MIKIKAICIFYGIFMAAIFMQCTLGKPIDNNNTKNSNQTFLALTEIPHLTGSNFTEYYVNRTTNTTRQILKDPTVIANHNTEVEEFKLNLTSILNKFDEIKKNEYADTNGEVKNVTAYAMAYGNVVEQFLNLTTYYFELPEEKATTDTKFIVDSLKKYGGYEIYIELNTLAEVLGHIVARALAEVFFGWMKPYMVD